MARLTLGPIVGAVSERSVKIWLQSGAPAKLQIRVYHDSGTPVPGSPFPIATRAAAGRTACIEVPLPTPHAHYTYDVTGANGKSLLPASLGQPGFWSGPPPQAAVDFSFGILSCHRTAAYANTRKVQTMWRKIATENRHLDLSFLLAVGDQVYADSAWRRLRYVTQPTDAVLRDAYRSIYEKQWDLDHLRRVWANIPTYMIWDDHEIRNGWGSVSDDYSSVRSQEKFQAARTVYREFQHAHNPQTPGFSKSGQHYAFRHGNVGVVVLDLRGHRTRDPSAAWPVMGRRQWRDVEGWIEDQRGELDALFVVTSIPMLHVRSFFAAFPRSDLRDQWSSPANRPERRRLLNLLFDTSNTLDIPVVLLGGDVHVGTMACLRSYKKEHEQRPLIYQLTSSPISNRPANEQLTRIAIPKVGQEVRIERDYTGRLMETQFHRNFGVVDLTWLAETQRYRIALNLILENGKRIRKPLQA